MEESAIRIRDRVNAPKVSSAITVKNGVQRINTVIIASRFVYARMVGHVTILLVNVLVQQRSRDQRKISHLLKILNY